MVTLCPKDILDLLQALYPALSDLLDLMDWRYKSAYMRKEGVEENGLYD